MKYTLLLLLIPVMGIAQETDKPNKRTNQIIVASQDTGKVLFDRVVEVLTEKNFPIQTLTESVKSVYTGEKQVPKWVIPMKLFVRVKENKVYISGTIKYTLLGSERTSDIDYVKGPANRSFPQASWIEMHSVAEALKGIITYNSK